MWNCWGVLQSWGNRGADTHPFIYHARVAVEVALTGLAEHRNSVKVSFGQRILEVLEQMSRLDGASHESLSLFPFLELNMIRSDHASIHNLLGRRS